MDSLKQLFREEEIQEIIKKEEKIVLHDKNKIREVIRVIADQKCNHKELRNIIMTYPEVLLRDAEELKELIYNLKGYGVLNLNKTFDNYPYILGKYPYEIDSFIYQKQKEGTSEKEMIRILEEEPYQIEMTSK